jgi:hypothetical protein
MGSASRKPDRRAGGSGRLDQLVDPVQARLRREFGHIVHVDSQDTD